MISYEVFRTIIRVMFMCALIVCSAACFYEFSKYGRIDSIILGHSPSGKNVNTDFFIESSLASYGVLLAMLAVFQATRIVESLQNCFSFDLFRMLTVFYVSVAILGVANDLGVAGGSLAIIFAFLDFII